METTTKINTNTSITYSFKEEEIIKMLIHSKRLPESIENVIVNYEKNTFHFDIDIIEEKEIKLTHEQIGFLNTPILELVYTPSDYKLSRKAQKALKSIGFSTLMEYYECNKAEFVLKKAITKQIIAELVELFKDHEIELKD